MRRETMTTNSNRVSSAMADYARRKKQAARRETIRRAAIEILIVATFGMVALLCLNLGAFW